LLKIASEIFSNATLVMYI